MNQIMRQHNLFDPSAIDSCSSEALSELFEVLNTPLHELTTEAHINELFTTYLCKRALGLTSKIKTFSGLDTNRLIKETHAEVENLKRQITEWMSSVSALVGQRKAVLTDHIDLSPAALENLRSEFVNSVSKEISNIVFQDTASVDYEESQLKGMFGDCWYMLDEYTRRSLISAKVFVSNCRKISYKSLDYSGVIVSATSALENELKLRFFIGYQNYLYNSVGKPAPFKWPQSMLYRTAKGQYVRNNNFTMGSLPFIFNCSNDDAKILSKYLQLILSDIYKNSGIKTFLIKSANGKSFIERCEDVRNNYRNAAAHTDPVSMEKAEACCVDVIGQQAASNQIGQVQGLLFDLVQLTGKFKKQ